MPRTLPLRMLPRRCRPSLFVALLASLPALDAQAGLLTFDTPTAVEDTSLVYTGEEGLEVTVSAWMFEVEDGEGELFGPFDTGPFRQGLSGDFGVLSFRAFQDLGQTDRDSPSGGVQPGFDAGIGAPFGAPRADATSQFAFLEFDRPVDVSTITVDDPVNSPRNIWGAGGNERFQPELGFPEAFGAYDFVVSFDDAGDGLFTHEFSPLEDIRFLAIGALPRSGFSLGPLANDARFGGGSSIYIVDLGFELAETGGGGGSEPGGGGGSEPGGGEDPEPRAVTAPPALPLLLFGLLAARFRRRIRR